MRASRWIPVVLLLSLAGCGKDDSTQVTVPVLTSITVTAPTVSLAAGTRQTISAQGIGSDGKSMTGVSFTYASASPGIAFVSSTGEILGVAAGTSAITVTGT